MLKLKLLVSTLTVVGLAASCAEDDNKKLVAESAGEGGQAGSPVTSSLGGDLGTGSDRLDTAGAGQSFGGNQGAGAPAGGGNPGGGEDATSGDAGGAGGSASAQVGAGGDSATQISKCGAGKYDAGEGSCLTCVAPTTVQIACSAYNSVLASSNSGNLLYARLRPAVAFFEPFSKALVVNFIGPTTSVATRAAFNTASGGWFIDLDAGPDAPSEFTVPPFTTTGACGHTYQSTQAILFVRTGPDAYAHSCP